MLYVKDFLTDQRILRSDESPESPLVSVVLPTYARYQNGFLKRAIESVLTQTFSDFELIIIDDGSRDGSSDFIERCRHKDPRVIHVRHENNSGLPALRVNEGIELARGQYLAFQFDDDVWLPNALKDLTTKAQQSSHNSVIVGKASLHLDGNSKILPAEPLTLAALYVQNLLANNSVLVPRQLFDVHGMYDCHIAMRRLCDWDLWLRLIKNVPFIKLDTVISEIYAGNPDSMGNTIPWDLALFRYLQSFSRGNLLRPASWRNYQVDSLRIGEVDLSPKFAQRAYEEHIVPYYLKFRHHFPQLDGFSATLPQKPRNAIFTRYYMDSGDDISLYNYDALVNGRQGYKVHFQQPLQINDTWTDEVDALLMVRIIDSSGHRFVEQALRANRPIAYYLDDDLLTFHEFGSEFAYLAPGTPGYQTMASLLSSVDAVWVTNEAIGASVRPYNPRQIPHMGSIRAEWLPDRLPRRDPGTAIKIGYAGGNYRVEEFSILWPAFQQIAREFGDQVQFEFWGLNPDNLPPLEAPVKYVPFTASYYEYIERLRDNRFDILVTPLLDYPRPRLGKSLIKYYETAVAGALGIFSDVPQYAPLPAPETCLKAGNTVAEWTEALRRAIQMSGEASDRIRAACIEHVRETYTAEAQINKYEAAWRATEFHALTRQQRHADGRPRVAYVFHSASLAGAEIVLWRRVHMMRAYGIEPIIVLPKSTEHSPAVPPLRQSIESYKYHLEFVDYTIFTEPCSPSQFTSISELDSITAFLESAKPALVHTVTFVPSFGQACQKLGIPHVASVYGVPDNFVWNAPDAHRFTHCDIVQSDSIRYMRVWREFLDAKAFCSREASPEMAFEIGRKRLTGLKEHLEHNASQSCQQTRHLVLMGTFQPRKCQLEAIAAVAQLVREGVNLHFDLYGYTHFFPEYLEACTHQIAQDGTQDVVSIHGFTDDISAVLEAADMLLSVSTFESLPSTVKESMAAGVLVVASPAGGLPELVIDGVTGILCNGFTVADIVEGIRRACALTEVERLAILKQARRVAFAEFHPQRIANDVFTMYVCAIERHLHRRKDEAVHPIQPARTVQNIIHQAVEETHNYPACKPVLLKKRLRYRLSPRRPNWQELSVIFGTHHRAAQGTIHLRILSANGNLIRSVTVSLHEAKDNDWFTFHFAQIANASGATFIVELSITRLSRASRISVYEGDASKQGSRFARGLDRLGLGPIRRALTCKLGFGE